MRFSSYRVSGDGAAGAEGVGVWRGERLHPVPGVTRLTDLLGDDGSRLRAAGQAALAKPGRRRADVDRVRLDGGLLGAIEARITAGQQAISLRRAAEHVPDHERQQEAGR